ncbi:MAG: hypothetical protein ACJ72K_06905, partial [Friedmanniella sp.]
MTTLIPPHGGAPGSGSPARPSLPTPPAGSRKRDQLAAGPRAGLWREVLGWLRAVLDRPLTSYHLV